MDNRYTRHNKQKYSLRAHIVLVTKYRKQLLKGTIADNVKQKIFDICNSNGWDIIAMETDKDHIHFLINYDTTNKRHAQLLGQCGVISDIGKITYGRNIQIFCLSGIGRRKYFGLTDILPVV